VVELQPRNYCFGCDLVTLVGTTPLVSARVCEWDFVTLARITEIKAEKVEARSSSQSMLLPVSSGHTPEERRVSRGDQDLSKGGKAG
jgi:hypothetical protein